MKKIKPIKPKLGRRIAAAVRALKGEPWPAQIVSAPLDNIWHYNIQAFGRQHVTGLHFDEWAPVDMDKIHREEIAAQLGKDLLQAGAIEITAEPASRDVHGPCAGTVYRAKVRVVMPEKEGQE